MLPSSQGNSCICKKQFTTNTAYLNHVNRCSLACAQTEKASSTGVSRLAAILERNAAKKREKDLSSQHKLKEVKEISKTDQLLESLKRKLAGGSSTEGTKPKRKRTSTGPSDMESTTSGSNQDPHKVGDGPPTPTSPPPPTLLRRIRLRLFRDVLPEGISRDLSGDRLNDPDPSSPSSTDSASAPRTNLPRIRLLMPKWVTSTNRFGLYREYRAAPGPSHIPDETASFNDFVLPKTSSRPTVPVSSKAEVDKALLDAVHPFPNLTSFWFRKHHLDEATNSKSAMSKFQKLLLHPRFKATDVEEYNIKRTDSIIVNSTDIRTQSPLQVSTSGEWTETSVRIDVPLSTKESQLPALPIQISGLHYRKLTTVIKTSLSNPSTMKKVHLEPYRSFWKQPGTGATERVFDEVYTSDAMLEAHDALQRQPREPGCDLERVVLALLFASDATHPTNFGQAKLWPLYMAFGNISKYDRCKPGLSLMEHVAYFPSIPDEIRDKIRAKLGKAAAKPVITHCHRELMHAIWRIILDDDFVEAWEHGIVLTCADGLRRRFYPRIFTYSADYPEKVLLATIRNLGDCPCPQCYVRKREIHKLGTVQDINLRKSKARVDDAERRERVTLARDFVYGDLRSTVSGIAVENVLKELSEVPTMNAFSERLQHLGFDFFSMLVNDWLHEWDLGEVKAVIQHLIRILYACKGGVDLIDEFNERFRKIPPFGRDTIRAFRRNVSDLKAFAGRDYEDVLQCIIPAIEGLVDEAHDADICTLLYSMAELMSLGKLRMHTESTLASFDEAVSQYGKLIRRFASKTCSDFETSETPREYEARARRTARKAASGQRELSDSSTNQLLVSKATKRFNLQRFKLHSLGHNTTSIRRFGALDGYSTMRSELEHRSAKTWYKRTNKTQTSTRQLTTMETLSRKLRKIEAAVASILDAEQHLQGLGPPVKPSRMHERYEMAASMKRKLVISSFIREYAGDPAVKRFWEGLRDFFISQLRGVRYDGEDTTYSNEERHRLHIKNDTLYQHSHLRVNYTTYDVRRAQDSISLRTSRRDIMVPANDAKLDHPFWYARVLGIYHAFVSEEVKGEPSKWSRIDVLWAGFVSLENDGAFGFIHPEEVIRASHIVPAFADGIEQKTIGHSFVQDPGGDYNYYYIMKFVDRDMYMRYRGDGIGHLDPLTRRPLSNTDEEGQAALPTLNEDSFSDTLEEDLEDENESSGTSSDSDSGDSTDSAMDMSETSTLSEEADETLDEEL
ncbi:hypothetical protein FRC01_001237 [Tulasnella sp. 417]|nr:hypothetical protein FRC01_001237 [Tulasnella sp. 417]